MPNINVSANNQNNTTVTLNDKNYVRASIVDNNKTVARLGDQNVIKVASTINTENLVDSLDDLIDVDLSGGSVDGSVLVYNSITNNYQSTNIIDGGSYW